MGLMVKKIFRFYDDGNILSVGFFLFKVLYKIMYIWIIECYYQYTGIGYY